MKEERINHDYMLPLSFPKTAKIDCEGCITIPYWIKITPNKRYLFKLTNIETDSNFHIDEIVKIRRGNKGKYISLRKYSDIFCKEDNLKITILKQLDEQYSGNFSTKMNKEIYNNYTQKPFQILLIYSYKGRKIIFNNEDGEVLNCKIQEFLESNLIDYAFKNLEEEQTILKQNNLKLIDINIEENNCLLIFRGFKRLIGNLDILSQKYSKEVSKNLYNIIIPYCILIITDSALLNFFLTDKFLSKVHLFSEKYSGIKTYAKTDLKYLIDETHKLIKSFNHFSSSKSYMDNSIFSVKFNAKIRSDYRKVVEIIQREILFGKKILQVSNLVKKIRGTSDKDFNKENQVNEALKWLENQLVIKISGDEIYL